MTAEEYYKEIRRLAAVAHEESSILEVSFEDTVASLLDPHPWLDDLERRELVFRYTMSEGPTYSPGPHYWFEVYDAMSADISQAYQQMLSEGDLSYED